MKLFYLSLLNQMNEAAAFSPEVNKSRWQCWLWTSGSPARRITFFSPLLSIHHFLLPLCPRSMTLWVILSFTEENPPIEETVQGSVLSPLAKINNREHGWSVLLLATFNTNLSHMRNISLKFFSNEKYICLGPRRMVSSAQIQPLFSFDIPFTDFSKLFFLKTTIAVLVTATCYKCLTD